MTSKEKIGKLTLVGAGPGDPELITWKGIKALATADVVLYDALVHPDLLHHAPAARKVHVGKRAGKASTMQEEIHRLMVHHALQGAHVVRLKGGDPFVFARGREELDQAERYGIPTAVVPGISSVQLAGYYGIPLTLRGVSESFWVVTATTQSGGLSSDLLHVAASTATAVILMGLGKVGEIMRVYRELGKGHLPVAIISRGSLPEGRVVWSSVDQIEELLQTEPVAAPGIILVGEAVAPHAVAVLEPQLAHYGAE
jgi:uroporphyrin-III C-methyltransferase